MDVLYLCTMYYIVQCMWNIACLRGVHGMVLGWHSSIYCMHEHLMILHPAKTCVNALEPDRQTVSTYLKYPAL